MKTLVKQIRDRIGSSHITIKLVSESSFLLERDSDRATISVVVGADTGTYSVQIERPDDSVPLIGFDVRVVGDRLSVEQVFDAVGKFVRSS